MEQRNQTPTLEEVHAHFESADMRELSESIQPQAGAAAADPGSVLQTVCKAYRVIRPFLQLVLSVPFLPPSWKKAIQGFVTIMDSLCPA